jgi:hypothetical protein
MKNPVHAYFALLLIAAAAILSLPIIAAQDAATPRTNGQNYHIFSPIDQRNTLPPPDSGPLVYHGGPVMQAGVTPFIIFWAPAKLQNGGATSIPAHFRTVQSNLLNDYPGHGIDNNNTQYYQVVGTTKTYIQNKGTAATVFIDTNAYPASGCKDTITPGNCITDVQLITEIERVMKLQGWTGGLSKAFLVYTSSGKGSCFDSTSSSCSYSDFCAYHSFFLSGTTPVVYANLPFGVAKYCQAPGTPSPNADVPADTAATAASHELTEAITDPKLNAWYTSQGNEIGDLCAYHYGSPFKWDGGLANQMWNGHFYMLQTEFENNGLVCVQVGP